MKLLMENWRSYLKELENTSEVSIPKKFYISIHFASDATGLMEELADHKVIKHKGKAYSDIVGFADNPSNFMQFHGSIRDATIVMPAKDFMDINESVAKIEYDNPDFLAQDGLKALFRLIEKNQDAAGARRVISSIFGKPSSDDFKQYIQETATDEILKYDWMYMERFFNNATNMVDEVSELFFNKLTDINDVDSLVLHLGTKIREEAETWAGGTAYDTDERNEQENFVKHVTPAFLKKLFSNVIVNLAKGYEEENEWVVDSNVLNIPASSTIYIAGPETKNKKLFHQMKKGELDIATAAVLWDAVKKMDAIMKAIEKYGLETKYKKVIITDMGTFNKAKTGWQKRRNDVRNKLEQEKELAQAAQ